MHAPKNTDSVPLARILRPVDPSHFANPNTVAELDPVQNIVFYNREVWPILSDSQRTDVIFLHSGSLELA